MKTAREWFETFPEPYRSQALENIENFKLHSSNKSYDKASVAIDSFDWDATSEGYYYWERFYENLLSTNQ